jgi:cell division protein FtsW
VSTATRAAGRSAVIRLDTVTIALVLCIVLVGLVMVTSASVSIATKESGNPFLYLERQLVLTLVGMVAAAAVFCVRTELLEKLAMPLLATAGVLLLLVLVPGIGHVVNGSRRWLRVAGLNFQVSEVARVLVLVFIASYAVRREKELRETFAGLLKPLGLLFVFFVLLLGEPDFGAATVLFVTGFGVLFLDPWADPFNTGFQLTQSLIAIGRGEWFGVGLGESVQKLFYLPEAHTDFLFAVLAEEFGLVGVVVVLGLFLALVWRAFWIARLAEAAGLKFASYLAAGFGLWLGIQAFINIGVNMGVLPTKGLTLPLMSYGRSSLIVTLAWVGMLLRVYHEAAQAARGPAGAAARRPTAPRRGGEAAEAAA